MKYVVCLSGTCGVGLKKVLLRYVTGVRKTWGRCEEDFGVGWGRCGLGLNKVRGRCVEDVRRV